MEQSSQKHVKGTLLPFSEYCGCLPIIHLRLCSYSNILVIMVLLFPF